MSAAVATRKQLSSAMKIVANNWPKDPFRPTVELRTLMTALADHPNLTKGAVRASTALAKGTIEKKYPLSDRLRYPANYPQHYSRLVEGWEKSAMGIARPRWKIFFNIW